MQLSKIIGAILNDLSTAQDLANDYSSQLSHKYKKKIPLSDKENTLSDFHTPSALLCEISLDLKFLIKEINPDGFALDIEKTQRNCNEIGRKASHSLVVLSPKIDELIKKRNSGSKEETDEDNKNQFNPILTTKRILTSEFVKSIEIHISQSLFRLCHRDFLLGNDLTESKIKDIISNKLEDELLKHYEIQDLLEISNFDDRQEVNLVEEIRTQIKEYCLACADNIIRVIEINTIIQKVKGNPHTDVIINPLVLKNVPPQTIQALQIKAKYHNSKWTISEASGGMQN